MFKPIKDFITFIQKNTSLNETESEIIDELNSKDDSKDFENDEEQESRIKSCVVTTCREVIPSDLDVDDIELQIKSSSIMLKNPSLKTSTPSPPHSKSYTADYNQNLEKKVHHFSPEEDDELADFKYGPIEIQLEDIQSADGDLTETQNTCVDEKHTEEDSDSAETCPAVKREIFVVIENDLNTSIASSNADDPLTIDIEALPSTNEAKNPLSSSTTDENDESTPPPTLKWFDNANKLSTKTHIIPIVLECASSSVNLANSESVNDSINSNRSSVEQNEEMERCDNSDSGLGTETSSLLQTTLNNTSTEGGNYQESTRIVVADAVSVVDGGAVPTTAATLPQKRSPLVRLLRSNLKRRYCDERDVEASSGSLPGTSGNSKITRNVKDQNTYTLKKPKRSINFDAVNVWYFPRQQGFGCVPSAGGCTLGMGNEHVDFKRLTLAEHAAELRRAHRLQLQEVNPRGSSSEETDESEEDYLSEGSGSDLDADSNGFLQPVTPKQRRAILKAAGIRKIDTSEKIDCRNIRNSREVCGCNCRDFCDPETCSCSQTGIKCQVDRAMFPCGCTRESCGNSTGRIEFNPARVRTHFIHTIMRLDMENRQQQQPTALGAVSYDSTVSLLHPSTSIASDCDVSNHNNYFNMQTQSNYSSGYASPSIAYTNEPNSIYYQKQQQPQPKQEEVTYSTTKTTTTVDTPTETPYHSLDSVDSSMPSYAEILPNYCPNESKMNYNTNTLSSYTPTYISCQEQDANTSYLSVIPNITSNNENSNIVENINRYSIQSHKTISTTCPMKVTTTNQGDFISLNTPIASSTRLSQINDLLQSNRNTRTALVPVTPLHNSVGHSVGSTKAKISAINSNLNGSMETPNMIKIEKEMRFNAFENDPTILTLKQPVVVIEKHTTSTNLTLPPPHTGNDTTPPMDYDSRMSVAGYTI